MRECPFCKWRGKEFEPFGNKHRKNAVCPQCGSLERSRSMFLFLKSLPQGFKVLHVAPENILVNLLRSRFFHYVSIDIASRRAMRREDLTNMSFSDNSFDLILCMYVLEHITDEKKALQEIYRVLTPDGLAILQVPIYSIDETFEDSNIIEPKDKEIAYGSKNHVRKYGKDYQQRLECSGFSVEVIDFAAKVDPKLRDLYGLEVDSTFRKENNLEKEDIYTCRKES